MARDVIVLGDSSLIFVLVSKGSYFPISRLNLLWIFMWHRRNTQRWTWVDHFYPLIVYDTLSWGGFMLPRPKETYWNGSLLYRDHYDGRPFKSTINDKFREYQTLPWGIFILKIKLNICQWEYFLFPCLSYMNDFNKLRKYNVCVH